MTVYSSLPQQLQLVRSRSIGETLERPRRRYLDPLHTEIGEPVAQSVEVESQLSRF